jgi:hypothetical protein
LNILVGGHYRHLEVLELPITLEDLPGVAAETVQELDHDDVGTALHDIIYHTEVLFTVVPLTGYNVDERSGGKEVQPPAILIEAGFLGVQGTVACAGLAGAGDPNDQ